MYVRVIACYEEDDDHDRDLNYFDCPVHIDLEKPLNGRAVIDVDTDKELPLFTQSWWGAQAIPANCALASRFRPVRLPS